MPIPPAGRLARAALLLCLAGCAAPRASEPGGGTSPAEAAMEIGIAEARIDSVFARFTVAGSPGCVATVKRAGDVAFSRGYGVANRETGEPLSGETIIFAPRPTA